MVGPLTFRLTRHAFSYESLGDVALRGKAGCVLVHRLAGPLETPRTARGLETLGLSAPLIGRDAELSRLLACMDLARNGSAQLVRLAGEAGIGKSRLVREFIDRIPDDPRFEEVAVRTASCSPLGERSYGTLAAVVRAAAGMAPNDSTGETRSKLAALLAELGLTGEEAERLTPLLYHVLGIGDPDAALQHIEPEQLRRQIFYAIRSIIERRLAMSPLLIVIEDLHWADAVSLEALRFVMDRLERTRLMLVVTQRPALENDPLDFEPCQPYNLAALATESFGRAKAAGFLLWRSLGRVVRATARQDSGARWRQSPVRRGNCARAHRSRHAET